MQTPSNSGLGGASSARPPVAKVATPTMSYDKVGPPTWLLILSAVSVIGSAVLLLERSYVASLIGLAVTVLTLALVSVYRFVLITREARPEFVAQLWQTTTATAILGINLLLSVGHAYFIALEIGKRWG